MDKYIVIDIILITVYIIGYFFIKHHIASYLDQKGKNLATKEDVAEITKKTEEVTTHFKKELECFTTDLKFKSDFYFQQYAKLYCKLYAIVCQSEYIRNFIYEDQKKYYSFEDYPFLEISPTISKKIVINSQISRNPAEIIGITETPLSKCNKNQLCLFIIENAEYANQNLLKLAMSYRFVQTLYGKNDLYTKTANDEELRIIKEIVINIIKEYNSLRKYLNLNFSKSEEQEGRICWKD